MTETTYRWQAGEYLMAAAPGGVVMLDPQVGSGLAEKCYAELQRGGTLGAVLQVLTNAYDLWTIPHFAIALRNGTDLHVVVRGPMHVMVGGEDITGQGVTTWTERLCHDVTEFTLTWTALLDGPTLPVASGVLWASSIRFGSTSPGDPTTSKGTRAGAFDSSAGQPAPLPAWSGTSQSTSSQSPSSRSTPSRSSLRQSTPSPGPATGGPRDADLESESPSVPASPGAAPASPSAMPVSAAPVPSWPSPSPSAPGGGLPGPAVPEAPAASPSGSAWSSPPASSSSPASSSPQASGHGSSEAGSGRPQVSIRKSGAPSSAAPSGAGSAFAASGAADANQDRLEQDDTGQDHTGQDDTGPDHTGQHHTGQPDTGQDHTGQPDTGQVDAEEAEPGLPAHPEPTAVFVLPTADNSPRARSSAPESARGSETLAEMDWEPSGASSSDRPTRGGSAAPGAPALGDAQAPTPADVLGGGPVWSAPNAPAAAPGQSSWGGGHGGDTVSSPNLGPRLLGRLLGGGGSQSSAADPMVRALVCSQGHPSPPLTTFCAECGERLTGELQEVRRPSLGRLTMPDGDVVELTRSVVVGRSPSSDRAGAAENPQLVTVQSPNQEISRSHVEIRLEGWNVLARDLGSSNGTLLVRDGAEPLKLPQTHPQRLASGDVLDLGEGVSLTLSEIP